MRPQPQIILLKEGTEDHQGLPQIISNINVCQTVAEAVKSTLGPRGMDKLIVNNEGETLISNDGATILKKLDIIHPVAKTLVDIAKSQDAAVGDGTTSVVLLAAELLKQVKPLLDDGMHPRIIIQTFKIAAAYATQKIENLGMKTENSELNQRELLQKCASTCLSSKLIHQQKEFFAKMAVDAVLSLELTEKLPVKMIGIKKVSGGALEDSFLVQGVAFKRTFSHPGFEMQPKTYTSHKIALLNVELELKAERENAFFRVQSVAEYQRIVDMEWKILYEKLEKIYDSGVKIVLSKLPIGDVATQYFADRGMFCAGKVPNEDMVRIMKACGGAIIAAVHDLTDEVLATCGRFDYKQIGEERYNIFTDCPNTKTCTIILRGGAEQFLEETGRSLHDAIMVVRRTILNNDFVVAGGGAIEIELSRILRDYSRNIAGKRQLIVAAVARALEIIPKQLAHNAGLDATNILSKLRQKHSQGHAGFGVDIEAGDVSDNFKKFVWEPAIVKINSLNAAIEAACLILSIDETIKNVSSLPEKSKGGRGLGRPF